MGLDSAYEFFDVIAKNILQNNGQNGQDTKKGHVTKNILVRNFWFKKKKYTNKYERCTFLEFCIFFFKSFGHLIIKLLDKYIWTMSSSYSLKQNYHRKKNG